MRSPTTDLTLDRFLMKDWADEKGDESENVKGQSQRLLFYQKKVLFDKGRVCKMFSVQLKLERLGEQ